MNRTPALLSQVLLTLAFVAMLTRAIMPDGWMVRQDAETRQILIETCHGTTVPWPAVSSRISTAGKSSLPWTPQLPAPDNAPDGDGERGPACPVAMSSVLVTGADPFRLMPPHRPVATAFAQVTTAAPPACRASGAALPARGPPLSV